MPASTIETSTLATVIVNFRTAELTLQAVTALLAGVANIAGQVIVVDNDSGDGSFERLAEETRSRGWGGRVVVLRSERNGGFGYGVNVGVRHALGAAAPPKYIYVLNSDAFPEDNAVGELVDFLAEHPDVGIAGSQIRATAGGQRVGAFRFPSALGELEGTIKLGPVSRLLRRWTVALPLPDESGEVDWISGTSFMVKREVFDAIGFFDEAFFLYYEEIDFCRRARDAGYKSAFVATSSVSHIGSVSTGMDKNDRPMPEYWFASRRRYFTKHHGAAYAIACNLLWVAGFSLSRIRLSVRGRTDDAKPHMLRDFVRYNFTPLRPRHRT